MAELVNTRTEDTDNKPEGNVSGDFYWYAAKSYKLGNDIDLSDYGENWNDGKGWMPIGQSKASFYGIFDGGNHKITGLYINDPNSADKGLFGRIGANGNINSMIKNLSVVDVNITGGYELAHGVGGLAGSIAYTAMTNCNTTGTVNGCSNVGGLAGVVQFNNTIVDSYSECNISGNSFMGGLAGTISNDSSAENCYATGNVVYVKGSEILDGYRIGGVVGWLTKSGAVLSNCYSTGTVNGIGQVGGVVGFAFSDTTVENCYATGAVSGESVVGGIVGALSYSNMTNCAALNTSVSSADKVGRVVGSILESTPSNNRAWSGISTDGGTAFSAERGHDTINGATTNSSDPADRNNELPAEEPVPTPTIDNLAKTKTYTEDTFTDIAGQWYTPYIQKAFEYGIISGKGDNKFDPTGNLTGAEALTIGAKIHAIYKYGAAESEAMIGAYQKDGGQWYDMYTAYCKAEGLIGGELDSKLTTPITRSEMVFAWSKLLQTSDMPKKNTVNSLPDITESTPYHEEIILFYEAGVISGTDANGTFKPDNNITRAECATIFMNLVDESGRKSDKTFGS